MHLIIGFNDSDLPYYKYATQIKSPSNVNQSP